MAPKKRISRIELLERFKCWRSISFSCLVCIFPGRVEMARCRRFVEILWPYTDRERQDNAPECPNRRPLGPLNDGRSASVQFKNSQSMFYVSMTPSDYERTDSERVSIIGYRAINKNKFFSQGFTIISTISCRHILRPTVCLGIPNECVRLLCQDIVYRIFVVHSCIQFLCLWPLTW